MDNTKKLSLVQLVGITMAFFGTVRSVPTLAATGWSQISYLIAAVILFAIPIALIAAELATAYPKEGGPQVWVKEAFGERFGFVTSWLLWVQMFFGMVMIASTIGVMLGYGVGSPKLAQNNIFVFICILVGYWLVTLLNMKFDMVKVVGNWGAIIGVYIPFILLIILGIAYLAKVGINPNGYLAGGFSASKVLPNFHEGGTLNLFSAIIFIFAGIEISSVHANNIDNPKKNYPVAIIITLVIIIILNLVTGLTMANAVPNGKMEFSNILQPFSIYFKALGIPMIFTNIIGWMIAIGILAQLSAWVLGPSKAMIAVAEEGLLPRVFQKRNKRGVPVTFVLIQAIVISLIAFVYVIVPNVNTAFLIITITTTIIYCLAYILMIFAIIKLRYSKPELDRPFKLGGMGTMWFVSILALIGVTLTIIASLIPPTAVGPGHGGAYIAFQVIASLVVFIIPLIIYACKKPSWKKEDK
ncbi:tyrosine-tyramine antiporter [Clostridium thermobutyricum]|uniref:tyrosine-tyramine antiporter n=1 Tax=uncultured Clostridium sp. TaxID=59620 RepID=UPI00258E0070|nr:tyrosine-tyramine antiporter [uncultured Clostridium sp.]